MGTIIFASTVVRSAVKLNHMPDYIRKRSFPLSSKTLRSAIEHLPSVNTRRLRTQKYIAYAILIPLNLTLMHLFSNYIRNFWWLYPLIALRPVVDFVEMTSILVFGLVRYLRPTLPKMPETPESFAYLLCCYNETYEEMMVSLESLAAQKSVEDHKKVIIVVCDGRVSTKGMTKTTAAHLIEDIIERPTSIHMSDAYTSWDGASMKIELVKGEFRGVPIVCLVKNENRGKRDGVTLMRSFLYKFNQRKSNPELGMLGPELFTELSGFLESLSIQNVDYVVGIDADTRFDDKCVSNLIQTVREGDRIIGVTGFIRPDPTDVSPLSPAYIYQNAEYMVGQYRRRLRQSLTSERVTCLPGCCQLLRVEDSTCGDDITKKFGYYPKETDGLFRTIQSMMSEDRDHICLVLSENPDVKTRLCLGAKAYTTAPTKFSVFLSQRRRWTLGPLTSDSLLFCRKYTGWTERLAALGSVLTWIIGPSLFFARYQSQLDARTVLVLVFIEAYRKFWDTLTILMCAQSLKDGVQLAVGVLIYYRVGPIIGQMTQMYTLLKMDDFRWGKTRIAIAHK
ncbi:glycosyltransferase family 2 protein [Bipolaris victoriae FI3]|uniref:chitin synthase n=1 Tax=Bipolaris victoriae (strain FI3) TaxID=930091 RepID=W7E367_BIPV3|nr:glycosyltransferase family 2 protein [Bipolaris victoriae FI3]